MEQFNQKIVEEFRDLVMKTEPIIYKPPTDEAVKILLDKINSKEKVTFKDILEMETI